MKTIKHWIDGELVPAGSDSTSPVYDPAVGEVIAHVQLGSVGDVDIAVASAAKAFTSWSEFSVGKRSAILFRFREVLVAQQNELAAIVSREHGKVLSDALGEIARGLEVVEFAAGIPQLLKGEYSDQASTGIDVYSFRQPVGVVAGITPFNFPVMVPLWMSPVAIAAGNTFVLKPSERDPSASLFLADLWQRAGLPDGVFNVVQGDKTVVDALLTHDDVAAVSFVGSTPIARHVHATATAHGKRVQALGGAKNHAVVLADADVEDAASHLTAAEVAGATLVVDGRGFTVAGAEGGFFVGPTVIDHVTPEHEVYREEVFGPVIDIVRVADLDAAIRVINENPYGNGTAIFTSSGEAARRFQRAVTVGMVGVNVPIPVPVAYHSFGGWKDSLFGESHMYGPDGVRFYTRAKVVTQRWPRPRAEDARASFHFAGDSTH